MQSAVPVEVSVSRPQSASLMQSRLGKTLSIVSATAFVAACAHVSLPLPFTPVPLTLSDFAVLLVGMVLGPAAGFSALVLYLAEGAIGLPVFNPIGLGGVTQLMGPTAGYLTAYPLAAALAGLARVSPRAGGSGFASEGGSAFASAAMAATAASAIILTSGAVWIAHLRFLNASATWTLAVAPFLFGAAAKIVAASGIYSSTRRLLRY